MRARRPCSRCSISRSSTANRSALLRARTGRPVIVNTSSNIRGELIVCTPEDAFRCFMGTEVETPAVGNCVLRKDEQKPALKQDYQNAVEAD